VAEREIEHSIVPDAPPAMAAELLSNPALPRAVSVPLRAFLNRYSGAGCRVVGRGMTTFDYRELGSGDEPVFFINDAVCLERLVRPGVETFFFAHDAKLMSWLNGAIERSVPVLPVDGRVFCSSTPGVVLRHAGPVVFYRWGEEGSRCEHLLTMTREQVADTQQLYRHSGTIHSLLHFVWLCGFDRVELIGCDGISLDAARSTRRADGSAAPEPGGHNIRLENRSNSWAAHEYHTIRQAQDLLLKLFGLTASYRGTPG
jgi:hypothetical protein